MNIEIKPVPIDVNDPSKARWAFTHHNPLTNSSNPTLIKAEPTLLYGISIVQASVAGYLKIHDTSLSPLAGSTPVFRTLRITTSVSPFSHIFNPPLLLEKGLAYTVTGGISDNDSSIVDTQAVVDISYR